LRWQSCSAFTNTFSVAVFLKKLNFLSSKSFCYLEKNCRRYFTNDRQMLTIFLCINILQKRKHTPWPIGNTFTGITHLVFDSISSRSVLIYLYYIKTCFSVQIYEREQYNVVFWNRKRPFARCKIRIVAWVVWRCDQPRSPIQIATTCCFYKNENKYTNKSEFFWCILCYFLKTHDNNQTFVKLCHLTDAVDYV